MPNPYRAFRRLERKLFRGVPEEPESIWGRHPNQDAGERLSLRSQLLGPAERQAGALLIASIFYGPTSERIVYAHRSCSSPDPAQQ